METKEIQSVTAQDYRAALQARNACNLTGVVRSFSLILPRILAGSCTEDANTNPISVLFAHQIAWLATGGLPPDPAKWEEARRICEERGRQG